MKQLINVLNTTLHGQPKQPGSGRPDSAPDSRALSSVAVNHDDNSDVALVPPAPRQNLGVTFVKTSPTVIKVPSNHRDEPEDDDGDDDGDDGVCYGAEPRFQLGAFFARLLSVDV